MGHSRAACLTLLEFLTYLGNFAALQMSHVMTQVGHDISCDREFVEQADDVFCWHNLFGICGWFQLDFGQQLLLEFQRIVDEQAQSIVSTDGAGEFALELAAQHLDRTHAFAETSHVLGHGEAKSNRHGVLAVGAADLHRVGIGFSQLQQGSLQGLQPR